MSASNGRFKRGAVAGAVDEMRRRAQLQRSAGLSRRKFLQAGAASAALGALPWLAGCGGDDDSPPPRQPEVRTIFFNHSYLDHAGKPMMLQVGMKRYALRPIAEVPDVLASVRANNRFLAAVPDPQITHAVVGVEVDPDYISLGCVYTLTGSGQWTMEAAHILLPQSAASVASARLGARAAPLRPSLKRRKYGLAAATSAQDLHEEQALLDTASQSATLIAAHKDMMGLDGGAAATVINAYVMNSDAVFDLDDQLGALGTATPETSPGTTNPSGWATLRPVVNKVSGQPFTMDTDGRIVYMPVLHPTVALLVGQGVAEVLPLVQDDDTLGADVTAQPAGSSLRGKLWVRRDGKPGVVQTAPAPSASTQATAGDTPSMAVNWPAGSNHWLECDATVSALGGGLQQLDVSYSNTGLRYLSCAIEFEDEQGNLIAMDQMPGWSDGSWVSSPPNFAYDPGADSSKTRLPIGGISCVGTVMGIPVMTDAAFYGSLSITMKLPSTVHKVRLLAGGLGAGSNNYPDVIGGGVAGTMLMNYCITSVFAAIGAIPDMDAVYSLVIGLLSTFLSDLASGVLDSTSGNGLFSPQFMIDQGMNLINMVIGMFSTYGVAPTIKAFAAGLGTILGEAIAEESVKNAIWFVGIALNVESAVAGFVDFGLTTATVAQSPFTYVTELVFTHDVTVTIHADTANDTSFPKAANAFKVTATFDDGKPWNSDWILTSTLPPAATATSYTFKGVPYGGNVQFEVAFVQRALDGSDADNILLGRGATDKLANDDSTAYALTITEQAFPIGSTTTYQHRQRTYLAAGNQHVWVQEPAPSALPSTFPCGSAGQICSFNGIAVRQGNLGHPTMLAYAWRGQNAAGGSEVDQSALMNADTPSAAYAVNTIAQSGGGLTLAISRNSGGPNNYYVDASGTEPMIRAINLPDSGNPTLDGAGSNRAFGMLNYASSALLVHPSGALVSVSGPNQRIEILNPPATPVSDDVARQSNIAQVLGFTGTGIGRMNSVVSATITHDGTLLVLEGGANNRIQAFDLGANPVRFFANAAVPYYLPLTGLERSRGWVHLDIVADYTGLLYLLSFNQSSGVYQVAVYDSLSKLQQPLMTTQKVYAARIGLDHWRNLYTLNYQPITVQGSGAAPTITEPSVSLWTPCNVGQTC